MLSYSQSEGLARVVRSNNLSDLIGELGIAKVIYASIDTRMGAVISQSSMPISE